MARIHLFEWEDQKWFPDFLRNYGTEFLAFLANKTNMFKPAIPVIKKGMEKSGVNQITDLGSGSGGGFIRIAENLKEEIPDVKIRLTDLYPNVDAFKNTVKQNDCFEYAVEPVNAKNVPENLKGLRTMFLAFHHFKPEDASAILQNAVDSKSPIAIFEGQERSAPSILAMLFSPITVLLTTPFIRPFSIGRIIFTYIIPIVPLFVVWDGVVSSLRTYSVSEMNAMVSKLKDHDTFEWEIQKVKSGPSKMLYLLGYPK